MSADSRTATLTLDILDNLTGGLGKPTTALGKLQEAEARAAQQAMRLVDANKALASFQGLDTKLTETKAKFEAQRATVKALGEQLLNAEGSTRKLQASFKRADEAVEKTRQTMERQQKEAAKLAQTFETLSGSRLNSVATAQTHLRGQIESTTVAIGQQRKEMINLVRDEERVAARRKKIGEAFSGVGMLVGPEILKLTYDAAKSGAEVQHRRVLMRQAGMGDMVPAIERQSLQLSARVKNVSQAQIMEMGQDARSVLTKPSEIAEVLPALAAARSVLSAKDPSGHGGENLNLLVKGAENLGAGQNPKRLVHLIDSYVKAMQVMGGTIEPGQIFDFAKNARSAGAQFSDRFLTTTAMSSLQEMGGQSAGKAANEAVGQLTSGLGKRTNAVRLLMKMGMIKRSDVKFNNIGEVSGVRPGVMHPVLHDRLLGTDPDLFTYNDLVPAMESIGITKQEDQIAAVKQIYSGSKGAQDLITKFITQKESYKAHAGNYPTASGIKGVEENRDDPFAALKGVSTSLETFLGVVTGGSMKQAAHALDDFAGVLGRMSENYAKFAEEHPTIAKGLGVGAVAGGLGIGGRLTFDLFKGLFGDKGLKAAAGVQIQAGASLLSAGTLLQEVAVKLGAGQVASEAANLVEGAGGSSKASMLKRLLPTLAAGGLPGLGAAAVGGALVYLSDPSKAISAGGTPDTRQDPSDVLPGVVPEGGSPTSQINRPADALQRMNDRAETAKTRLETLGQSTENLNAAFDEMTAKLKGLANGPAGGATDLYEGGTGSGAGNGRHGSTPNLRYGRRGGGRVDLVGPGSGVGVGHLFSAAQREANIRSASAEFGIDPRYALAVARSEGFHKFTGDKGTSFGDFQMHVGNRIPGLSLGGLGDIYRRTTGKSPADPKNELELDRFALKQAAKGGWGPWHGWHGSPWAGINAAMPRRRRGADHVSGIGHASPSINSSELDDYVNKVRTAQAETAKLHSMRVGAPGGAIRAAGAYRTAMNGSFAADHWRRGA